MKFSGLSEVSASEVIGGGTPRGRVRGSRGQRGGMKCADAGCRIKRNVNQTGERIYFLQGDRNYARVRMDRGAGKRWFCSEDQAIAAGWRAAHMR